MQTCQQLWDAYQNEVEAHGEWSDEAHKAWEKWSMVAGRLRTANPV